MGGLESSTYGYVPTTLKGIALDNITSTNWIDVVNVQGSGRLWMAHPTMDWNPTEYEWKVTIDGKATTIRDKKGSNENKPYSFFVDRSLVVGTTSTYGRDLALYNASSQKTNSAGANYQPGLLSVSNIGNITGGIRLVSRDFGEDCIDKPTMFISKNGVLFQKNLRVQVRKINASFLTFGVCYSLN